MTWTYGGPTSDKDKIRYLVQDTDSTDQLVTDEEIIWELSQHTTVFATAAAVAAVIARKFARQALSIAAQDVRISYTDRATLYWELVKDFRIRSVGVSPFAGGISVAEKDTRKQDSDRVTPLFRRDQFAADSSQNTPEQSTVDTA